MLLATTIFILGCIRIYLLLDITISNLKNRNNDTI